MSSNYFIIKFKIALLLLCPLVFAESEVPDARPTLENRTFTSQIVEGVLEAVGPFIADDTLRQIFRNCLPNTLDTTILFHRRRDANISQLAATYIITGDIPVMWIRDSAFQVEPYISLAGVDAALSELILGLINTQAEMLAGYTWANAFHPLASWDSGITLEPNVWAENDTVHPPYDNSTVFEAKYELDSVACFLRLSANFYKATRNGQFVDNPVWVHAVEEVVKLMKLMQAGTVETLGAESYNFTRPTRTSSETQNLYGRGNPVRRCGLIRSFFRPSDDATVLQFLIPSNALAVVGLRGVGQMLREMGKLPSLSEELLALANQVDVAIRTFGIVAHPNPLFGAVYAFEVDCFGGRVLMDDAGYPSLLSLPGIGYGAADEPIYLNTRKYILSSEWNPYYTQGLFPSVGSPHAGLQQSWPMAMIMQGLTSKDEEEITRLLWVLRNTTAGTGLMHETFDVNDPTKFTRDWFAWANSFFGQFILHLYDEYPHLLQQTPRGMVDDGNCNHVI